MRLSGNADLHDDDGGGGALVAERLRLAIGIIPELGVGLRFLF